MLFSILFSALFSYTVLASPSPADKPVSVAAAAAGAKILAFIAERKRVPASQIDPLFKDLQPIPVPDVFGIYAGGLFCGTCKSNWAGKQFVNETYVNPLLMYPSASNHNTINVYPKENIAKIRNVLAYNKTQATVIYNSGGIKDYLRIVVNDAEHGLILIGKATMNGLSATPPYFYLKKDPSMTAKVKLKKRL